jgi:DNA repair photolyase
VRRLSDAGIPVTVMVAPIVPGLTCHETESILEAARDAGAQDAGYVLLRMPHEIKDLFREWLREEFPGRADRVISLLQSMHGGRDYVSEFGIRQRGTGPYAAQIAARFRLAKTRLGLGLSGRTPLRTDLFRKPNNRGEQLDLL